MVASSLWKPLTLVSESAERSTRMFEMISSYLTGVMRPSTGAKHSSVYRARNLTCQPFLMQAKGKPFQPPSNGIHPSLTHSKTGNTHTTSRPAIVNHFSWHTDKVLEESRHANHFLTRPTALLAELTSPNGPLIKENIHTQLSWYSSGAFVAHQCVVAQWLKVAGLQTMAQRSYPAHKILSSPQKLRAQS